MLDILHVRKGGLVTVPCKPTHPNVTVSLLRDVLHSRVKPSKCDEKILANGTKWINERWLNEVQHQMN
jgi:hypothetical protein